MPENKTAKKGSWINRDLPDLTREPRFAVKVLAVSGRGPDCLSIRLERPSGFLFEPGQYIWLVLPARSAIYGAVDRHAYCIASAKNADHLELLLRLSESDYSKAIAAISVGDAVQVIGPMGSQLAPAARGAIMIADGVGISSFLSLARSQSPKKCSLFWFGASGRFAEEKKELRRLLKAGRFDFSEGDRPTPKLLREQLADKGNDRPCFIYGSQEFVDFYGSMAAETGIDQSRLHFGPVRPLSTSENEVVSIFRRISSSGHVGSLVTDIDYLALAKTQANEVRLEEVVENPSRLVFFIIVLFAELALSICYFFLFQQRPIFLLGTSVIFLALAVAVKVFKDKGIAGHLVVGSYFALIVMSLLLPDYLFLLEPWSMTMPLIASKFVRPRAALWYSLSFLLLFVAISITRDGGAVLAGRGSLMMLVQYTIVVALVTALTQFTARRERFYSEAVSRKDEIQKQFLSQMERANRLSQVFAQIFQQTSNHVVFTDCNGRILFANSAAEKLTGYTFNEMRYQTPRLWGGLMNEKYYSDLWKQIGDGGDVVRQMVNRHRSGRLYTVLCRITPLVSLRSGRVFAYVSTEEDISELQEIDKAKTEFVSMASHQLQTPLAAINWYSELLAEKETGRTSALQKRYIKEIADGGKRMSELVRALLNVTRIDLDRFMIDPKKIDARKLLESVIKEQKFAIDEKSQRLTVSIHGKQLFIGADPKLLQMVFQNLLSNAIKYTPEEGSISIEAGFRKKKELFGETVLPADSFCFAISDTGFGIPEEQQPKIFSKLFRANNARAKVTDGTGLGLYIVKSILERAGGDIWFKSEENRGTSFYVIIPTTGMRKKTGDRTIT